MTVLPLLTSALALVFAALVFAQWWRRRRAFQLVWALGLLWYAIAAGTEAAGGALGWSEPLYRTWYFFGALMVAAWLGMGTVYLLARTRFGYAVAVTVFVGGLFALASQARLTREGMPTDPQNVAAVIGVAALAGVAIAYATWRHRPAYAHLIMGLLLAASAYAAVRVLLLAPVEAPGYAIDPVTQVPIGAQMAGDVRVMTGPFNIAGAFSLIFGALFSAYVFMPKTKLMRGHVRVPVLAQLYVALAVTVNFLASLPRAASALAAGRLHSRVPATLLIAVGAMFPAVSDGLSRFGITEGFFIGQFVGIVLIFVGFVVSTEVFGERVRIGPWRLVRREAMPARDAGSEAL